MRKDLYLHMIIGTLAMISIGIGVIHYHVKVIELQGYMDFTGWSFSILGIGFTTSYIYKLEEKLGIEKKIIWIQSLSSVLILVIVFYFLYF